MRRQAQPGLKPRDLHISCKPETGRGPTLTAVLQRSRTVNSCIRQTSRWRRAVFAGMTEGEGLETSQESGLRLTLTALSQPPDTNRLTGCPGGTPDTRLPFGSAGAHDTAVAPSVCAPSSCGME